MEPLPLEDDEQTELEALLGDRSLATVVGMLAAVASVPEVLPSQLWLGEVMRGIELENAEQVTPFIDFIMRLNNHVATAFVDGDPMRICPSDGEGIDDAAANADFCTGYLSIVRAAGVDAKDDELLELLERIAEGKEDAWGMDSRFRCRSRVAVREVASATVVPQQSPKVGRNDPCHCGSGKKFKRGHGAPS